MSPTLSVIIPTYKRPELLRRAINTALEAAADGNVEVVVVPNGADYAWQRTAQDYKSETRVRWHHLGAGNACAARNHGLQHASGKYVRFLDDDDFLYPEAAKQLQLIQSCHADVCSAPLQNISSDGKLLSTFCLPTSRDYPTVALLSIGISGLTQGSIFSREAIKNARWREGAELYDDYFWMLDLARNTDLAWVQSPKPVGAYVQHHRCRLSRTRRTVSNSQQLVTAIMELYEHLRIIGRSTPERASAVATALLTHAHSAFPASPIYLGQAIRKARAIAPDAAPLQGLFSNYPLLSRYLLAVEWAMIVPRYITRGVRRASWFLNGLPARVHREH